VRKFFLLTRSAGVYALLHDAAAVLMASYLHTVLDHAVEQKLAMGFIPTLQNFLDHMVSIDVVTHLD
jgi:hypothetical protein